MTAVGPTAIVIQEMSVSHDMSKHKKLTFAHLSLSPTLHTQFAPPMLFAAQPVKIAICQSKRLEGTFLHPVRALTPSVPWYEMIGTARQFDLAQPNVVHITEEHISILDDRTTS
tara:strand:- start:1988 stop:2329 length:342 start_codon:yes stop_codon:yes gene_type:complete